MRNIQPRHDHWDPRLKDHFRGLRINVDIKPAAGCQLPSPMAPP